MNTQIAKNHPSFITENKSRVVSFLVKAFLGSLLIAISAQITIPSWPVPMTLQPTALIVIGLIATPRIAVATVIAYILEGACGLPVFHAFKSGIPHLLNTTGGYIFGFIPMIYLISSLKDRSQTFLYRFGISLLGYMTLYMVGISYLSLFVGFSTAIQLGLVPFLVKTVFSISFAILSANLIQKFKTVKEVS
ncbi:MAG: biotin transporter BioY [Alphaproteobacteria bacterium]|nr:biotin transporter BioY [Alphaproteobacteria bacterium]